MTETRVEDVSEALRAGTKSEGHSQFTDEARRLATDYASERKALGVKMEVVAAELKMNKWTLQRWLQRQGRGEFEKQPVGAKAGFSRVKVKTRTSRRCWRGSDVQPESKGARVRVAGADGLEEVLQHAFGVGDGHGAK